MKRYSRGNEDEYLQLYFGDKSDGFFVDIGANDGVTHSNTRQLFERGWSGIAVEACLNTYCELFRNYQNQDRVRIVHAAVTDKLGVVNFYENSSKPLWELNSAHKPWIDRLNGEFAEQFNELTVPSLRLQDMGIPKEFDFLSVDTEGGDMLILSTLDENVRPRLICAELDKFDYSEKIKELMKSKGYKHLLDVEANGFFERA